MSANRKPSKATHDEIREFYQKTKDVISKNGMFYDPITKKYKKALKQDGKSKGSGRPLVADTKYQNYLKRLNEDERGDLSALEQLARDKGFSQLQKERKLFGQAQVGAAGVLAAEALAQKKVLEEAKKAVGKVPTDVEIKKKGKGKAGKEEWRKAKKKREQVKRLRGKEIAETPIAQTKLKKKEEPREEYEEEKKYAETKPIRTRTKKEHDRGSEQWYNQMTQGVYRRAERKGQSGEEAMKLWRTEQIRKYGLPPHAKKQDIMNAVQEEEKEIFDLTEGLISEEVGKHEEAEKAAIQAHADKAIQRAEEATKREESVKAHAGNLRKKRLEEGKEDQEEQKDKIENVIIDVEGVSHNPLADYADVEQEVDHREPIPADESKRGSERGRMRGYEEERGETKEEGARPMGEEEEEPRPPPPPPTPQSGVPPPYSKVGARDEPPPYSRGFEEDPEVEIERGVPGEPMMGQSFISPASERVSMERNRMRYSQKRLYEECKSFVKIYSDDIKTPSWKRLLERFKKMSEKSPVKELRKLHRELEEEVIEYYQGRKGLRLGIIIDPSVLGINVGQLQGMMNPQMPMAMGGSVTQVGTQQKKVKTKDIHYHLGGVKHATGDILPEGENLVEHQKDKRHIKGRIKIPIHPPNRWLLNRSGRSQKPVNLKIK